MLFIAIHLAVYTWFYSHCIAVCEKLSPPTLFLAILIMKNVLCIPWNAVYIKLLLLLCINICYCNTSCCLYCESIVFYSHCNAVCEKTGSPTLSLAIFILKYVLCIPWNAVYIAFIKWPPLLRTTLITMVSSVLHEGGYSLLAVVLVYVAPFPEPWGPYIRSSLHAVMKDVPI